MYIFIDESGIHKTFDHSTIVLVYIEVEDLDSMELKIKQIEQSLHIGPFHWSDFGSKKGWKIRRGFITLISALSFSFKVAVIKNPINFNKDFQKVLLTLLDEKGIKKIVIDGRKPKSYLHQLKKALRDKGLSVKKIVTANDKASPVLRLADALCGLLRSFYDKPTKEVKELFEMVQNKITAQMGGQETW